MNSSAQCTTHNSFIHPPPPPPRLHTHLYEYISRRSTRSRWRFYSVINYLRTRYTMPTAKLPNYVFRKNDVALFGPMVINWFLRVSTEINFERAHPAIHRLSPDEWPVLPNEDTPISRVVFQLFRPGFGYVEDGTRKNCRWKITTDEFQFLHVSTNSIYRLGQYYQSRWKLIILEVILPC